MQRATQTSRRASRALAAACALALVLGAGGCMEELTAERCALGMRQMCLCADGSESAQRCAEGSWSGCECGCNPYEARACRCADGEDGAQVCSADGAWGSCLCDSAQWDATYDGECAPGETLCEGVGCVSTAHSENNCGGCGVVCQGCDRCIRGECTASCCEGQTNCGTVREPVCAALPSDNDHCGVCGLACAEDEHCVNGQCSR